MFRKSYAVIVAGVALLAFTAAAQAKPPTFYQPSYQVRVDAISPRPAPLGSRFDHAELSATFDFSEFGLRPGETVNYIVRLGAAWQPYYRRLDYFNYRSRFGPGHKWVYSGQGVYRRDWYVVDATYTATADAHGIARGRMSYPFALTFRYQQLLGSYHTYSPRLIDTTHGASARSQWAGPLDHYGDCRSPNWNTYLDNWTPQPASDCKTT
jgi:hypothetical protein